MNARAIAENVAKRQPALDKSLTAADLRHYLAHLGELPGADKVRLALASFLVERGRSPEAEIELLQLLSSTDRCNANRGHGIHGHVDRQIRPVNAVDRQSHGHAAMWTRKWFRPPRSMPRKIVRGRPASPPSSRTAIARYAWSRIIRRRFADTQWFIAMDCSEIVGRNRLGRRCAALDHRSKQFVASVSR